MERTNNFLTVPNERQGGGFPKNNSTLQPNATGRTDSPEEEKESNLRNDPVYNQGGSHNNKKTQPITFSPTKTVREIPQEGKGKPVKK